MSDQYGDLNIINGRILNLLVEEAVSLPTFDADHSSRLISVGNVLYFNNGTTYATIQIANGSSQPIVDTIGAELFNIDLSFNPVPANALNNVSGLISTDSIFTMITQLDAAISAMAVDDINDIGNVAITSGVAGQVLVLDGTNIVNYNVTDLIQNFAEINFSDLEDFLLDHEYQNNDILAYSSSAQKIVNKKFYYTHDSVITSASHVVTHNLGQRYCMVQLIDKNTNQAITTGYTINYVNSNRLTVTLGSAKLIRAIVLGISDTV